MLDDVSCFWNICLQCFGSLAARVIIIGLFRNELSHEQTAFSWPWPWVFSLWWKPPAQRWSATSFPPRLADRQTVCGLLASTETPGCSLDPLHWGTSEKTNKHFCTIFEGFTRTSPRNSVQILGILKALEGLGKEVLDKTEACEFKMQQNGFRF